MNEIPKMICFDMDGTIAGLYNVRDWCIKINTSDPSPYEEAPPMWDMTQLTPILEQLMEQNIEIRIITWLAKTGSKSYNEQVRRVKKEWLIRQNFPYDHFHALKYGTTKADSVRKYLKENETAWLVDDNKVVRAGWHLGKTIDPAYYNIIEILKTLIR
jgi:hypothetical protein